MNVLTSRLRIKVNTGGEEPAYLIVKRPSADRLQRFLKARTKTVRNKLINCAYEARIEFIDELLVDVEGVAYESTSGEIKPLSASVALDDIHPELREAGAASWKDMIPANWKSSAAMYFEDSDDAEEDAPGNF